MATNCTDTTKLYDDVEFCPGQIVLPGTRDHAYFSSKRNIAKWPTLPLADAESLDKVAVYDGDFKMELDKVKALVAEEALRKDLEVEKAFDIVRESADVTEVTE